MWIDPKDVIKNDEDKEEFFCAIINAKVTLAYCKSHSYGSGCSEFESCKKLGVFKNAL